MNRKANLILGPCAAVALGLSGYGSANASESSTVSYEGSGSVTSVEFISDMTESERTLAGLDRMTNRGSVGPSSFGGSSGDRIRDLGSSDRTRDLGSSGDRIRDLGSSDRTRDLGSSGNRPGDRPGDGMRDDDRIRDELILDEALIIDEVGPGNPNFYQRTCERATWPQQWAEAWCDGWWTLQ
ncbi:hypothetical protein [Rhodococcus sp. NPDC049939]|uniref:hypothetical protein n=1 Tax=Rhodococcus sp. NPDC049939 TaxID=3155511 RepID=UPI0033DF593A